MSRLAFISLVVFFLVGVAQNVHARQCDFSDQFEQCVTLPTSMVCGDPGITASQLQQIAINQETVNEIEAIGRPIYEGTAEARILGLTRDNPIVDLTFNQNNFFRQCNEQTLLAPQFTDLVFDDFPTEFRRRRKRQVVFDPSCCDPSPVLATLLASVDTAGNAVEVVQPLGLQQAFQDTRFCPVSFNCNVACGAVETVIPAEVIILSPTPAFGRQNIIVNICGAIP